MTAGDVQPRRCAVYSDRVALPHGLEAATITVEDGLIANIEAGRVPPPNDIEFVDCGACALLPGLIDVLRGSDVYESAVEGGFSTVVHLPSRFGGPELRNDEPLLCDVVIAGRATSSYIPVVSEVCTLAPCDDVNGATTDETWLQAQVRRGVLVILLRPLLFEVTRRRHRRHRRDVVSAARSRVAVRRPRLEFY